MIPFLVTGIYFVMVYLRHLHISVNEKCSLVELGQTYNAMTSEMAVY